MKKNISIFFVFYFLLFPFHLNAQQPTQQWVKRFTWDDYASGISVKLDSSGNVYVLMQLSTDSTRQDFGIVKYTPSGNLIWNAYYNSPGNLDDISEGFAVTCAGDAYITGYCGINFNYHITTVKFNSSGVFQWAKVFNGGANDDYPADIAIDKKGNIIVAGSTYNGVFGSALIIKYNQDGDSLWVRKFIQSPNHTGISEIVLDDSNNVYTAGVVEYEPDYLMLKYNQFGNLMWYTTYNNPQNTSDIGEHIAIDSNRNVYVVGTNAVPWAGSNNTVVKLDDYGAIQWASVYKGLSGTDGSCGIPGGIVCNVNGTEIYAATQSTPDYNNWYIVTIKYSSIGDTQWVRAYRGGPGGGVPAPVPSSIRLDRYGGIYLCSFVNVPNTGNDYVTIKYHPNGTRQWVATYNGPLANSDDGASDLFIDTSLNVYVTGVSSRNNNPFLWDAATIKYNQIIGIISNSNELPQGFELFQNYPNPFNSTTVISYAIPKKGYIKLFIYNATGQLIKILVNSEFNSGYYSIVYNAEDLSSGVYFYQLLVDKKLIMTKKLILVK